ncbi:MAG TPA: hypothetical protein VHH32_08200, partial [Gemmatimonadales bacterium]|nr:hypothetical protein [Gemmatimonadales bacterium]
MPIYSELEVLTHPASETVSPPIARVVPRVDVVHGEAKVDHYHWLRDRNDPEVLEYLEAENRHTDAVMRHTENLQEQLYQEMRRRIQETDLSVAERVDHYWYYSRTEAGVQYPIFCRRQDQPDAVEEILLDQNSLVEGQSYFRIGGLEVSPDHRLLAYLVDTSGKEEFSLFIKDLRTGELYPERITGISPRVAWANDSQTIFYTVLDPAHRPYTLFRHRVGSSPSDDILAYQEPDASFSVDISRTRSRRYLLLDLSSHSTSEVRFISADTPEGPFEVIEPRRLGIEYTVSHHEDRFFITTNDAAPNFRLLQAPVEQPSREHWSPVLPYRPDIKLDGTDAFRHHLVVYERNAGLGQIRVLD